MTVPVDHRAFASRVAEAKAQDPKPTFTALAESTGIPVDELVHYALVRWAAAGSELLMAVEPQALRDLVAAREREDWEQVAGIIDWLESGRSA
jgi:N-glycosylase/DNA lyase